VNPLSVGGACPPPPPSCATALFCGANSKAGCVHQHNMASRCRDEKSSDICTKFLPLPLTVSCSSKILIGFTFLVPAHPGSPGQRTVKRVCVCVCGWLVPCVSLNWLLSALASFWVHVKIVTSVRVLEPCRSARSWLDPLASYARLRRGP